MNEIRELYSTSLMPPQKLESKKKTKAWREANVDYIINSGNLQGYGNGRARREELQINYDLYNSIYNENDLKYVTDPYKQRDGFPASPKNFNIIRPKIDLLLGEETKRPFNFAVTRTSEQASSEIQDRAKQMIMQFLMAKVTANMSPEEAQQFQQQLEAGEIQPPEQIQKYLSREYKDVAEVAAYHIVNYLRKQQNIDHEFMKAWKDLLCNAEEHIYVGIQNNKPHVRRVNPMHFAYEYTPTLEFIDEANWCVERMRVSYTEAYDMLFDKLEEKDLDKLLTLIKAYSNKVGERPSPLDDFNHINIRSINNNNFLDSNFFLDDDAVDVYHCCWRSFRKIGFLTILNEETGQPEMVEVDDTYVKTGNELSLEWEWILEIWEGYKIMGGAEPMYCGIQPLSYQHVSADNPNSQHLPYTGCVFSNTNTRPMSLVALMKPLQYMYIIIWYRLELAIAKDKGKILNMDITQIPKSLEIDFPRWAHMLQSIGINLINPYEEGWGNNLGGHASSFNQIAAVDLTTTQTITQYIELLAKIEDMVADISGVTKQRQGAIENRELVGNVERSVIQSSHITEPWFWAHNQVKKRALTMLLNTAKKCYQDNDIHSLNYIMDDGTRIFLQLPSTLYEDMDIFVTDSSEDLSAIQQLQSLYQVAMQQGATLGDIAEIMTMKNMTLIKERLNEIDERNQQRMEQAQQAEMENQQQLAQMKQETDQAKLDLAQAQLELERYKVDQDNATKIAVAEIQAFRFQKDLDVTNTGTPDPIEIANTALAKQKQDIEAFKVQSDIQIAREQMESDRQIQKDKDEQAMARERVKAAGRPKKSK